MRTTVRELLDNVDGENGVSHRRDKKAKRNKHKKGSESPANTMPTLFNIAPMNEKQRETFRAFEKGQNLILHGVAGTGKTFLALYLALRQNLGKSPVVIIRSVVPTRDVGFLPGSLKEKVAAYEQPYVAICNELFPRSGMYESLKLSGHLQFATTSFLRGLTFRNNTVIIDECANLTFHELDTVITRMGEGCRVLFSGDFRQSDLWRQDERNGLPKFMQIVGRMSSFTTVEFQKEDIVRSAMVKEYILAKLDQEDNDDCEYRQPT